MALNPHQRQSHQILGAGIVLTGALILAIGLIIGLEFPRYIRDRIHSRACVTSPASHDYMDWLHNRNRSKYNVLRIWNLTNLKEFLTEGQAPQFSLTEPYVFMETEEKKDISFNGGHVTYRVGRTQTFDPERTAEICPDCSPDDTVIILNPAFLQRAGIHQNETNFYRMLVPTVLSDPRLRMSSRLTPTHFPRVDRRVGAEPDPAPPPPPWRAEDVDFDAWLQRHHPTLYRQLMAGVNSTVTPSAYLRVYEWLGDTKNYGGDIFLRPSLMNACLHHYASVLNAPAPPAAPVITTLPSPFETMANASIDTTTARDTTTAPSCGLFFYLLQLGKSSATFSDWWKFRATLSSYFCDDAPSATTNADVTTCFLQRTLVDGGSRPDAPLGESGVNLTRDYLEVLTRYAVDYLPDVIRRRVALTEDKLWQVVTVRDAAVGYYADAVTLERMDNFTFGRPRRTTNGDVIKVTFGTNQPVASGVVRVRGFLDHSDPSLAEEEGGYHRVTLRTCLYNRTQQNNLNYEAIDGFHAGPEIRNGGRTETLLVHGQQDFKVRSANKLMPCRSPAPTVPYVILYSPETWRPANFVFAGYANYRWVALHDYRLQLDRVDELSHFSTSGATGYPSWVSPFSIDDSEDHPNHLPKTVHGGRKWMSTNNRVLIEPVSGQVWRTETFFSYWVGFWWPPGGKMFDPGGAGNSTYGTGVPLRSHQVTSYTEPDDRLVALYQHQIHSLLQASCTGIISLSIVGSVVILIGIGVAFSLIHRPPYRVSPQPEDPQTLPYDGVNVVLDRDMEDEREMMDANVYF